MEQLLSVEVPEDIPIHYRGTPVAHLLEYHNLGHPFGDYTQAVILVAMCMDNRKHLHIPDNFAYIIRTGGANLRYSEFKVSYAVAVGGVKAMAIIAHNRCGMVNLMSRRDIFVRGLVDNAGWDLARAQEHFMSFAPMFEIDNEIDFALNEARRLRRNYPRIIIAPLFYKLENNRLYLIRE